MNRFSRLKFDVALIAFVCLAGWLIFNLVQTIGYVLADYSQIPVEDYWRVPQLWANPQTLHWSNLWVQHNEHRILFPELSYIVDMFFLGGRMYLPIALNGACYFGVWVVVVWAAYSQKAIASPAREFSLLLAGVMMFWKGCSSVIATPFQLSFTLLELASALSLFHLSKCADSGQTKYLCAVIAAATLATYSVANGMLLWPVLILAALFLKIPLRQIITLTLAAVFFIGLFFFHYVFLPSAISTNIKHPVQALAFLCSYFSMPFGGSGPPANGFQLGALNLILMAFCGFVAWRKGFLRLRLGVVLFGTYLFFFASALLTTAGRMDLHDFQFDQAKAWRYVTVPAAAWALLAVALLWMASTVASRHWLLGATVAISGFFGYGFYKSSYWVETTRNDAADAQITATMLRNGLLDSDQLHTIFPFSQFVLTHLSALQEAKKSIYNLADQWLGGNLLSLPVNKTPLSGKVTRLIPIAGGLEIFGWVDNRESKLDHGILFVDDQNRIVGFGRRPAAGLPLFFGSPDTPNALAFVGYVSKARPHQKLSVYVRTNHGRAVQPLDQILDVPSFTQLASTSDHPPLPDVAWIPDASWTPNGYTIDPENGPAPKTSIYASWSGSDAKTGLIRTAPFATPPDQCIVLPVLHGTSTYGQSVEIKDADSDQTIASLPFLDGHMIWQRWRITIPNEIRHISIVASDQGTGPIQWLAVATPEQCSPVSD